ncbi:MAG: hypothetical protein NT027_09820 [Proteobacteria bacterium]|nr:hypothetical protein [Pseudomonadota bacterium]
MSHNDDQDTRKRHNEQLIKRMKAGESLWSYDSKASWFPPRPIIEKDPEAIKRLYKTGESQNDSGYRDPTVRHIESRLKVITGEKETQKKDKIEDAS